MTNTDITVLIKSYAGKTSHGEVRLQSWEQRERARRALKFLGLCWGLSIVSIIIPLAHFLLVPGFFLGGIFGAYLVYCQDRMILGGQGTCPECQAPLPIAKASDEWPLKDLCSACQKSMFIEKIKSG